MGKPTHPPKILCLQPKPPLLPCSCHRSKACGSRASPLFMLRHPAHLCVNQQTLVRSWVHRPGSRGPDSGQSHGFLWTVPALLRDCYLLPVRCVLICDMRCCCLTPNLREGQRGRGWHARGGTEPCPPLPGLKPGRRLPRPPRAWQVLGRAPSPGSGQSPGGLTGSLPKLLMPQLLLCPGGQRDFCPSLHAEG